MRGVIERLLLSSGLCLLNKKEPTFFSATHNTFTSIDLSISSPSLFPCFTWKVLDNPFGSDHLPIILESFVPVPSIPTRLPRWKLEKADWSLFGLEATLNPSLFLHMSPEDATLYVTDCIINAASAQFHKPQEIFPAGASLGGMRNVLPLEKAKTKPGEFSGTIQLSLT